MLSVRHLQLLTNYSRIEDRDPIGMTLSILIISVDLHYITLSMLVKWCLDLLVYFISKLNSFGCSFFIYYKKQIHLLKILNLIYNN